MQIEASLRRNFSSSARKRLERVRKTVAAGTWARPAQDRALKRGDGALASRSPAAAADA